MEYVERSYRRGFRGDRWAGFTVAYKETDLWIGVDRASYRPEMEAFCAERTASLRTVMEAYLADDAGYLAALEPYDPRADAPGILHRMSAAARAAGIGPMGAVAGAVAEAVGRAVRERFAVREIVVENGGDIYADMREGIDVAVFAGASPLSGRVGLRIPATLAPVGVCTSSGTVGPSLSFGRADAVMTVCRDAMLADSWATALGNLVRTADDVGGVAQKAGGIDEIIAALIVKDDKMSVVGELELIVIQSESSGGRK